MKQLAAFQVNLLLCKALVHYQSSGKSDENVFQSFHDFKHLGFVDGRLATWRASFGCECTSFELLVQKFPEKTHAVCVETSAAAKCSASKNGALKRVLDNFD